MIRDRENLNWPAATITFPFSSPKTEPRMLCVPEARILGNNKTLLFNRVPYINWWEILATKSWGMLASRNTLTLSIRWNVTEVFSVANIIYLKIERVLKSRRD